MKLVSNEIDKHGRGAVKLFPQYPEDMWHLYNIITIGDTVTANTVRKVQKVSKTGSTTSDKVRTVLTVRVEAVDFDSKASALHIKGKNVVGNEYVRAGAHHTVALQLKQKLAIGKEEWDSITLERLNEACCNSQDADLAIVIMQEGLGQLCLITNDMTQVKAEISVQIPRKRAGACGRHAKALTQFYNHIYQAIIQHTDFAIVKCVILASPGFVKDDLFQYMMKQTDNAVIQANKSSFLLVHASNGFKHSLKEVLANPAVKAKFSHSKVSGQSHSLEEFLRMIQTEPERACYSLRHVQAANEAKAISTLMISDELFRADDVEKRSKYVALVDSVKENGGNVQIFSSLHVSGEQLTQLSGIAAILRFGIPELEYSDDDETSDDSDDDQCDEN